MIFFFLSKTPPIDSGSEGGKKLEKLVPTVEFKNVGFSYPTRQNVQVYYIDALHDHVSCHVT